MTASLTARLTAWRRHRRTVGELDALSDAQLADVGIRRMDIPDISRGLAAGHPATAGVRRPVPVSSLSYVG